MSNLQVVFVSIAAALIFLWIVVAIFGMRKTDEPGTLVVLRYGSALRVLALVLAWGAPGIVIYVLWTFPPRDQNTFLAVGVGYLIACLIPGMLLIEVERTHIAVTEDELIRRSPWTGKCIVKWSEVTRVGYSRVNQWIVISAPAHTIRISRFVTGLREFVKIARRKLAPERYSGAAAAFDACS
jgi:hypothetical protein